MFYIIDTSNDSKWLKIKIGGNAHEENEDRQKNRHHNLTIRKNEFREKALVLELWSI